jgi:hypothetical protein
MSVWVKSVPMRLQQTYVRVACFIYSMTRPPYEGQIRERQRQERQRQERQRQERQRQERQRQERQRQERQRQERQRQERQRQEVNPDRRNDKATVSPVSRRYRGLVFSSTSSIQLVQKQPAHIERTLRYISLSSLIGQTPSPGACTESTIG